MEIKKIRYSGKDVDGSKTDMLKNDLASIHEIQVIRINCLQSKKEYIKNNILKNKILLNIINNNNIEIDWECCDIYAHKNILKEVCETWNNGEYSVVDLVDKFNLSKSTILGYLNKGSEIGFCKYSIFKKLGLNSKALICNEKYAFSSQNIIDRLSKEILGIKIHQASLSRCLQNGNFYKDFCFRYMTNKEFFEYYLAHPELCFY